VGAVVGELAAGFYNGDTGDGTGKPKADTTAFAALISGVAGALVGGDAQSVNIAASTGANAALNNYLNHAELTSKKEMQGLCSKGNDLACKAVIAYNDLDLKRNAALDACVGVVSPACDTVTTQASKDIQGLAGYAADMRNKFAKTGDIKYKQEMDNAQWELKEAAAGLKNYYYVASGGNVENPKGGTNANYAAYKYLEALTGDGVELGSALTGAPTANPSNKAMGRLTDLAAPPLSAADKRKAEIELNARTDDGQQYVNSPAPVTVPNTTTRKDNDFSSPLNSKGNPKASTDADGNLNAANPDGTGDIKDHVRGANPDKTPYISTTDNTIATNPKNYGTDQATVDTRQLQRDINNGTVDGTKTQIVTPVEVQATLQKQVDAAQARYEANPTPNNKERLDRATDDLQKTKNDGECLVKGCIPAPYIQLPTPQLPAASTPSINPVLITPPLNSVDGEKK
jgi:filamentous hemagglutinin